MSRRFERIVLVLVVCVPVPALALSGLTVPLPSMVERVAAALVPFANAATLDSNAALASGVGGRIVLESGQAAGDEPAGRAGTYPVRAASVRRAPSHRPAASTRAERRTTPRPESGESSEPTVPAGAVEPHGDGGTTPAPAPAPTQPTVEPTSDSGAPAPEPDVTPPVDPSVKPTDEPDVRPPDAPDVKPTDKVDLPPTGEVGPPPVEPDVKPPSDPLGDIGDAVDEAVDEATGTVGAAVDKGKLPDLGR